MLKGYLLSTSCVCVQPTVVAVPLLPSVQLSVMALPVAGRVWPLVVSGSVWGHIGLVLGWTRCLPELQ